MLTGVYFLLAIPYLKRLQGFCKHHFMTYYFAKESWLTVLDAGKFWPFFYFFHSHPHLNIHLSESHCNCECADTVQHGAKMTVSSFDFSIQYK